MYTNFFLSGNKKITSILYSFKFAFNFYLHSFNLKSNYLNTVN